MTFSISSRLPILGQYQPSTASRYGKGHVLISMYHFNIMVFDDCQNSGYVIESHKLWHLYTGTCFIQKIYAPSSSLLQSKYLPLSPSPLLLNMFCLFVILSLTQLYRYTPEIFLFSTATFKYTYRTPSDELDKNIPRTSLIERDTATSGLRWIFHTHSEFSRPAMCNNAIMIISSQM